MPYLRLTTNQPLESSAQETLKTAFGEAMSCLGKTESWLMVEFAPEKPLYFKGTGEPAAILSVDLYGADSAHYNEFTGAATGLITNATGIPADRVYVKYSEYAHWGWNGSNF